MEESEYGLPNDTKISSQIYQPLPICSRKHEQITKNWISNFQMLISAMIEFNRLTIPAAKLFVHMIRNLEYKCENTF